MNTDKSKIVDVTEIFCENPFFIETSNNGSFTKSTHPCVTKIEQDDALITKHVIKNFKREDEKLLTSFLYIFLNYNGSDMLYLDAVKDILGHKRITSLENHVIKNYHHLEVASTLKKDKTRMLISFDTFRHLCFDSDMMKSYFLSVEKTLFDFIKNGSTKLIEKLRPGYTKGGANGVGITEHSKDFQYLDDLIIENYIVEKETEHILIENRSLLKRAREMIEENRQLRTMLQTC